MNRQEQILDYITQHIEEEGYPPTVRMIGEHFGLSSTSTVHSHLKQLERQGKIERVPGRKALRIVKQVEA